MAADTITFIVRASKDKQAVFRCLNSIKRQSVNCYNTIAFSYSAELSEDINNNYPEVEVIDIADNKDFKARFNDKVAQSDSKYCVAVNSDEIVAPNAAECLLQCNEGAVVFNIARLNPNNNFAIVYKECDFASVADYLGNSQSLWNIAFSPALMRDNNIKLYGIKYEKQALFALQCLANAETVGFNLGVLAYKETVSPKKEIPADFFLKHKKQVLRAIRKFAARDMQKERIRVIEDYVLSGFEDYYNDKSIVSRRIKRLEIRKFMGL